MMLRNYRPVDYVDIVSDDPNIVEYTYTATPNVAFHRQQLNNYLKAANDSMFNLALIDYSMPFVGYASYKPAIDLRLFIRERALKDTIVNMTFISNIEELKRQGFESYAKYNTYTDNNIQQIAVAETGETAKLIYRMQYEHKASDDKYLIESHLYAFD
jgi:hypothetical protein